MCAREMRRNVRYNVSMSHGLLFIDSNSLELGEKLLKKKQLSTNQPMRNSLYTALLILRWSCAQHTCSYVIFALLCRKYFEGVKCILNFNIAS